jgi:predicted AAA+ superfamily ATPase
MIRRYLETAIREDALADGKMAFVSGPRQVGKSTLGRSVVGGRDNEFTWWTSW